MRGTITHCPVAAMLPPWLYLGFGALVFLLLDPSNKNKALLESAPKDLAAKL